MNKKLASVRTYIENLQKHNIQKGRKKGEKGGKNNTQNQSLTVTLSVISITKADCQMPSLASESAAALALCMT